MIEKGKRGSYTHRCDGRDRAAGLERRIDVQEALRAAGLDAEGPSRLPISTPKRVRAMCRLLDRCPEPGGVICALDIIAHGAMKALKEGA